MPSHQQPNEPIQQPTELEQIHMQTNNIQNQVSLSNILFFKYYCHFKSVK
jgi:hypothetical protein